MTLEKMVVAAEGLDESWGPALKESGFRYHPVPKIEEALGSPADCVLLDARKFDWGKSVSQLKEKSRAPILSVIKPNIRHDDLERLKASGLRDYVREGTPPEELVVRIRAMTSEMGEAHQRESRAARRIWFQQPVEFRVFDRSYSAWSTTLSETGVFLRTHLSFPLYSVIRLKFDLLGDYKGIECDGVIVRQEGEGPIRGIGVMFQNLTGENVRSLESFLQFFR